MATTSLYEQNEKRKKQTGGETAVQIISKRVTSFNV